MQAAVPTAKFYVMYGQTEASPRISCLDPERLDEKLGSAGRPLDNLTVRIVDENERDLPTGEIGQILVKGPSISSGYLNDSERSRRVFKDGWLRTGDLAHLDEDGYIWIHGRKTSFLKIRGVRVSLAEVETTVATVPGVYECVAAAVPHEEAGEALVLWVVPEQRAQNNIEKRVRRSLPVHWTCESIKIVSEIPKTSHGKISLSSLRGR
jgi:acyl-CoA synthetase (AMP-forming)/AMP-acid ligase II